MKSKKVERALESALMLLITDASGIYIPQRFAENLDEEIYNAQDEQVRSAIDYIKENGPDGEWYWEEWQTVTDNYERIELKPPCPCCKRKYKKVIHTLYQNGDLWEIDHSELNKLNDEEKEEFWNSMS